MRIKSLIATIAMIAVIAIPQFAAAEQVIATGGSPSAQARVNFSIVIPSFLLFRVGAAGGTINSITFDLSTIPDQVGNSTVIDGSGGDVDAGGEARVTVRVVSNAGLVTITENLGDTPLTSGVNTISWDQVQTTSVNGVLAPPTLSDAGGGFLNPPISGSITNSSDEWAYKYLNATIPVAGTYNGQATYDAATP